MTSAVLSMDLVRKLPLLAGFNETEHRQMAEIATLVDFQPGDVIMREGDYCRSLWIIVEGTCRVTKQHGMTASGGISDTDDPIVLAMLEPYQNFGEMSFFHSAAHSASVEAVSQVRLLRIDRVGFDELVQQGCSAAYKLAYNVVGNLAERLRRMDDWVTELYAREGKEQRTPEWHQLRLQLFERWTL